LLKEERDAALSARNALAKQANEMEERAERNAALHAEVMRERDALLKPHNSDGTITCPECGKSMGGDGLVEALRGAIEERDQLYAANDETNVTVMRMQADLDAALAAQKDLQQALDHLTEDRDAAVKDMLATEAAQKDADRERGLLRDKWNQMEAYGFDSPSKVFARLELVEKAQKEAEERLKWHHDPETRAAGYCEACANAINNSDYLRTRTETKA
jgi:hypothetical protein